MRGRNRNKGPNPLTRTHESNGPDVKVRGTAQHIADKYAQLARDAQASGDPVAAENYFQHAEHYYRMIAAAQEQYRQQYGGSFQRPFDEEGEEGEDEVGPGGFGHPGADRGAGDEFGEGMGYPGQGYEPPRQGDRPMQPRFDNRQGATRGNPRFDRAQGGGFDRPQGGDRYERPGGYDRPQGGERYERQGGDRYERQGGANGERMNGGRDRFPRQEQGPREAGSRDQGPREQGGRDREGNGPREPRPDREFRYGDREGRPDRDSRGEREPRGDREGRAEREVRGDREGRGEREGRGDRPPAPFRAEPPEHQDEAPGAPPNLPAFLTTPLRQQPFAIEGGAPDSPRADAEAGEPSFSPDAEDAPVRPARRRRTRKPVESDDLGLPRTAEDGA